MQIPKNPIILIDGSSYLFRAYYALPPLTSASGQPTGAIYGVINMLNKLLNQYQPEYCVVVFDSKGPNFRHELFPEYKANRTVMPDDLAAQIAPLHASIKAMGLPLVCEGGVEADDVIGSLARKFASFGKFILISTMDKDLAQLVNDNIVLINTMNDTVLDIDGVIAKFKITPEQIVDYLTLIGDSSDNIPGVTKVGPKTAVKWLEKYGSLQNIKQNSDEITGKVGENLRSAIANDELELYEKLITIKDINVGLDLEDIKVKPKNIKELKILYKDLSFNTWLANLQKQEQDIKPPIKYKTITKWQQQIKKPKRLSIFVQDSKDSQNKDSQNKDSKDNQENKIGLATDEQVLEINISLENFIGDLQELISQAKEIVAHDLKRLQKKLLAIKTKDKRKNNKGKKENEKNYSKGFDIMLASYVINSTFTRHDLESITKNYLGKNIGENCAEQAATILELYHKFAKELELTGNISNVFYNIEIPLIPVLLSMEQTGVLVNKEELIKQSKHLEKKLQDLQEQIYLISSCEFNINSPKQLQEVLYDTLHLPILQKTPTGQPSTAESVLQELAVEYELPALILEYRSISKLKSTYTDKLPEEINPDTGRIHTNYHQAITATGRLSSSEPNLQNIPIRTELGRKVRQAFIAPPGYKILTADYSQIELRIMAHLSQDANLLLTFENKKDVHAATASEVFAVSLAKVTKEQRRRAKAINFGLIYGMSAFGLSKQLGIKRKEAEEYLQTYFAKFPGVKDYMEQTRELVASQGFVETLYGRRLYLPDIKAKDFNKRRAAERAAINAPMQGAQADIIKMAMINIHDFLKSHKLQTKMLMQVHDELIFEVAEQELDFVVANIENLMTKVVELSVDLTVQVKVGKHWNF